MFDYLSPNYFNQLPKTIKTKQTLTLDNQRVVSQTVPNMSFYPLPQELSSSSFPIQVPLICECRQRVFCYFQGYATHFASWTKRWFYFLFNISYTLLSTLVTLLVQVAR